MQKEFKQVIVVRKDLKLSKGKLAVQVAHASIGAYEKSGIEARKEWEKQGGKKVVLFVADLKELLRIKEGAKQYDLPCTLIRDAGRTEVPSGTVTAVGIGPCESRVVDRITGNLKMV